MRVNYISNLDLAENSGGWSGINVAINHQLSRYFDLNFVGPISPGNSYPEKLVSKLQRLNGRPGAFHFFSDRRLTRIARLVEAAVDESADLDFFHGQTPWILYEPRRPYFLYTDTSFSTYVDVYHDKSKFFASDLNRIAGHEKRWLEGANKVFFGTHWAMERAIAEYDLPAANLCVVGAGGSMAAPKNDAYEGGLNFLFVAVDFEQKGGRLCAEAFEKVHALICDVRLTFVGDRPPAEIMSLPGVSYAGFLRKSVPAELAKLDTLYAKAFALVHPTSADVQPLVIAEAGYYGCPTIAALSFGIPEMIQDNVTGLLVPEPLTANAFAVRMLELCRNREKYLSMRIAVRQYSTANLTWEAVGTRIVARMQSVLS